MVEHPYHPGEETLNTSVEAQLEQPYSPGVDQHVHLPGPMMSWGVYDETAQEPFNFDADGGHLTTVPGHRYLIVLKAQDDQGIENVTLDGDGMFDAATDPDSRGQSEQAPNRLPAHIARQEFNNHAEAPKVQDLFVVMDPDIGAFDYGRISCGVHNFGGSGSLEYFAYSGTMTFVGASTNSSGGQSSASLTASP